jgi:hypothetical protein
MGPVTLSYYNMGCLRLFDGSVTKKGTGVAVIRSPDQALPGRRVLACEIA